jgi:methyl-accepting chemotaxis protein
MTTQITSIHKRLRKSPRFWSIRTKVLIGFTVVFTGIFAGTYAWFYRYASELALERLRDNLVNTYRIASTGIEGDRFAELADVPVPENPTEIENNALYQQHQNWLISIADIDPRALSYTYIQGNNPDELLWIGDAFRALRPDDAPTLFKESYIDDSNLLDGLEGVNVIMEPLQDEWGTWIFAFGPITNSSGEVVGALGVDFSAQYLIEVQRDVRTFLLIAFAIAYVLVVVTVYMMADRLTKPIVALTKLSEAIGDGDYSQHEQLGQFYNRRFHDEISQLASVYESMVKKVYRREETLKNQISVLKIEIDQSKRSQQVQEIVDTDYFQSLQKKARSLRRDRNSKT